MREDRGHGLGPLAVELGLAVGAAAVGGRAADAARRHAVPPKVLKKLSRFMPGHPERAADSRAQTAGRGFVGSKLTSPSSALIGRTR